MALAGLSYSALAIQSICLLIKMREHYHLEIRILKITCMLFAQVTVDAVVPMYIIVIFNT